MNRPLALLKLKAGDGTVWYIREAMAHDIPGARHTFTKWWRRAESLAGLEHDERWGWHSLRRKFASDLRNALLRDVCDLGGWKSSEVVVRCYMTADMDSMRQSLSSRGEPAQDAEMDRVHSANTLNEKRA